MKRGEDAVRPYRAPARTGAGNAARDSADGGTGPVIGFTCARCGLIVSECSVGTRHRNHCPHCLWSLHVDVRPGDRAHLCRAPMEPVALWALSDGERRIIHRCTRCGVLKANRVAGDDAEEMLERLAVAAAAAARGDPNHDVRLISPRSVTPWEA